MIDFVIFSNYLDHYMSTTTICDEKIYKSSAARVHARKIDVGNFHGDCDCATVAARINTCPKTCALVSHFQTTVWTHRTKFFNLQLLYDIAQMFAKITFTLVIKKDNSMKKRSESC